MTSRAGREERGFTLIETLVVLAIVALAAVALLPARSSDAGALRLAERELMRQLRGVRASAIEAGRPASLPAGGIALPRGVTLLSAGDPLVTFFPDGSASGASLTLRGAGGERAVRVDWLTGVVSSRS